MKQNLFFYMCACTHVGACVHARLCACVCLHPAVLCVAGSSFSVNRQLRFDVLLISGQAVVFVSD